MILTTCTTSITTTSSITPVTKVNVETFNTDSLATNTILDKAVVQILGGYSQNALARLAKCSLFNSQQIAKIETLITEMNLSHATTTSLELKNRILTALNPKDSKIQIVLEIVDHGLGQIFKPAGENFISPLEKLRDKIITQSCFGEKGQTLVAKIDAAMSELNYFPGWGDNDAFSLIIKNLYIGYNRWLFPIPRELHPLACVSKQWNSFVTKIKNTCLAEHSQLHAQETKLRKKLKKNCDTAEKAVEFIITNYPHAQVANLQGFRDITEDLIDKLLQNCPHKLLRLHCPRRPARQYAPAH